MKQRQPKNLVGIKWGRLEVVSLIGLKKRNYIWLCKCRCGGTAELRTAQINRRITKSCGCITREMLSARSKKHGEGNTPLAAVWRAMIARCHNPKNRAYQRYGGRGIKVCPEWRNSFLAFKKYMGERPTGHQIDRFPDKNGDYKPGNVRWATVAGNQRNRNNNKTLTHDGVTKLLVEWAEEFNIPYGTLWQRVKNGWDSEKCLFTKVKGNQGKKK